MFLRDYYYHFDNSPQEREFLFRNKRKKNFTTYSLFNRNSTRNDDALHNGDNHYPPTGLSENDYLLYMGANSGEEIVDPAGLFEFDYRFMTPYDGISYHPLFSDINFLADFSIDDSYFLPAS